MAAFDTWLTEKLNSLNLDEEVYSDYLKSVLDEEEADSLHESLAEILSGVLEDGANEVADEIVQAWQKNDNSAAAPVVEERLELNANLKALIEQQGQQENKTTIKKRTGDDYLKQKLLAQYGEVSDEEDDVGGSSDDESAEFVNVNAQAVADKGAAEREKAKQMHVEKKLLDKSNLEKDKSKKEDRKKEAQAKAAKGERRGGR